MRVVLDTNILLSALLVRGTAPDLIFGAWRHGEFDLASCAQQLEEINRVSRRPFFKGRRRAAEVGRMINRKMGSGSNGTYLSQASQLGKIRYRGFNGIA